MLFCFPLTFFTFTRQFRLYKRLRKKDSDAVTDTYKCELAYGHSAGWQRVWWESIEKNLSGRGQIIEAGQKKIKIGAREQAAIKEKIAVWKSQAR